MGRYPWLRRRRFFISAGLQGRFVAGLAIITAAGLVLNLAASYFLIDRRLEARLYKIHLQVNSTLDIIWPAVWKLSLVSAFLIALGGVVLAFFLARRLEAGLSPFLAAMKRAGEGDLTTRVGVQRGGLEGLETAFNSAIDFFRQRFQRVQGAAVRMRGTMNELKIMAGPTGAPLERDEIRTRLEEMISLSDEALKEISKLRV
jgi:methyl-accepting chemotaxis protein